jgi:hypothetical protein
LITLVVKALFLLWQKIGPDRDITLWYARKYWLLACLLTLFGSTYFNV